MENALRDTFAQYPLLWVPCVLLVAAFLGAVWAVVNELVEVWTR